MFALLEIALSNAAVATLLALLAFAVGRMCRRPALTHSLWLIVLLKLVTPPIIEFPIASLPTDGGEVAAVKRQVDDDGRSGEQSHQLDAGHAGEIDELDHATELADQSDMVEQPLIAAAPASVLPSPQYDVAPATSSQLASHTVQLVRP